MKLILPPTQKSQICIFCSLELAKSGKSMSITKLLGKIGFEIFPDFEVP